MTVTAELADGRRLEFPDGTDPSVVQATVKKMLSPAVAAPATSAQNPSEGGLPFRPFGMDTGMTMPQGVSRFAAGAGKAFTDLARGAGQLVGAGPSPEEMSQIQQQDKPLMQTGAGMAGNVTGNIAATLPAMAIPGVNTYAGAAALGAGFGALQPTGTNDSRLMNTAVGAAGGVGGQYLGNKLLSAASAARPLNLRQQNAADAINAGYSLPPSEVKPSLWSRILSGGNKHAMADEASLRNARVLAENIRKDLPGLKGEPTPQTLGDYRQAQYDAGYKPVEALPGLPASSPPMVITQSGAWPKAPPAPDQLLHDWKSANARMTQLWSDYRANHRVETMDAIEALKARQDAIQKGLENAANAAGKPELIAALRESRTNMAKAHDVERAMADTSVPSAGRLATTSTSGKLSGELETAYKAAKDFPDAFKNPSRIHPSDPWGAAALGVGLGIGGDYASNRSGYGHLGATLAAVPFLKGAARQMALSRLYQQGLVNPETGVVSRAVKDALSPPQVQALIKALRDVSPQLGAVGVEQGQQP